VCVCIGHSIIVFLHIRKFCTELSILNTVFVGIRETFSISEEYLMFTFMKEYLMFAFMRTHKADCPCDCFTLQNN